MSHVKIPAWAFILLLLALAGSIFLVWYVGRGNSDLRDDVERFQAQLRAAYDGQTALGLKLAEVSGSLLEAGESVSSGMVGLEYSQLLNRENLDGIADSQDAERMVEGAIIDIGDFINEVDRLNQEGTGP